jgi:CPA2 family monovalent cation:H+ antiporter-2
MHIPALISDLALMLTTAGVMTILFKKLRQPLVLGYIIAGFIVGPYFTWAPSVTDTVNISTWSEIGIIILMFSLGLEFNLHKLASVGGTAIITAMTAVAGMFLVGFSCGHLLRWSMMNSVFLGGMLSMSSTTIIIKAFEDLKLKQEKFTELVFGTLVIEDIAGIFMMVLLSTIAVSQGISGGELIFSLLKMLFYLALWLLLGIYLLPTVLKKAQQLMNDETLLVVSLGICLGMVLLANHLGFSSALGAFLAGSLLAGTIHAERIEHISKPIKDLFGAVFFISVGMMVNPALILAYIGPITLITLVTVFGKPVFAFLGTLLSGQSLHTAVRCGCSLAQIGEFSFIIASLGISLGVISDYIYPIVVSVSVITTFTTPFIIGSAGKVYGLLQRRLPRKLVVYLETNTSENQSDLEKDSDWAAFIKKYFSRLALYSTIMLGIIVGGVSFLQPFLADYLDAAAPAAAIVTALVILGSMAPFLRHCLMQRNDYFISLWFKGRSNHIALIALTIFRLAVMIVLIMTPLRIMFDFSTLDILLAAVVVIVLIYRSDWLIAPYLQIEARFLTNFNERQLDARKHTDVGHSWLDEQIYVSRIVCTPESEALYKPLPELMGKQVKRSSFKIIKIIRGHKHVNIPESTEHLEPGDIAFLAGSVQELNNFSLLTGVELTKNESGGYDTLRAFIKNQERQDGHQLLCYAVTVDKDSKLAGVSVKDSPIKREWGGLLLGLERNLYPILSPNINLRLQENDLIWILGSQKVGQKLARAGLL